MTERVVIITGAARRIGLASTQIMLREGATVIMVDNDQDELTKTSQSLENTYAINCDVSDANQVSNIIASTLDKYNQIDCLINNAGVGLPALRT